MTEWSQLRHAYGEASEVPALLERLSPDPKAEVWDEVWSRLCHQGTVYTASFAALPKLLEAAAGWLPDDRPMILSLAAAIVSSDAVVGDRDVLMRGLETTVASLERLARETLGAPGLSATDFIYVAQAILAFKGDPLWGRQLDRLTSGEFEGRCTSCDAYLSLAVGQYGFFATSEEWVNRPLTKRVPIRPADGDTLVGVASWLRDVALQSNQPVVASWVQYIFGDTECPACGRPVRVEEAIKREGGLTTG